MIAVEYTRQPEGAFTQLHEPGEAPLSWVEVQALATQHDVELLRKGQAIILRLPRARGHDATEDGSGVRARRPRPGEASMNASSSPSGSGRQNR